MDSRSRIRRFWEVCGPFLFVAWFVGGPIIYITQQDAIDSWLHDVQVFFVGEDDSPPTYYGGGDLDCDDFPGTVIVANGDPHHLDADGDGIGCEANN